MRACFARRLSKNKKGMLQMANDGPTWIEARLGDVTGHRLTAEESRVVRELLEMARKPFDVGRPTGEEPAVHFLPAAPEAEVSAL